MKNFLTGDLGRGFDQAVGRMVDWLGSERQPEAEVDTPAATVPVGTVPTECLRLCRYTLVSVRRSALAILERGELMVADGRSLAAVEQELIEAYLASHAGEASTVETSNVAQSLRVHLREVGSWIRRPAPALVPEREPAKPKAKAKPATVKPARVKSTTAKSKRSAKSGKLAKQQAEKSTTSKPAAKKRPANAKQVPAKSRSTSTKKAVTAKVATGKAATAKKPPSTLPSGDLSDLDAILKALGDSATLAQLVKHTGASRAELRTALGRQIEAGTIERAGQGLKTLYRRRSES